MGIVMRDLKLTKESRPIRQLGGYIDSIVKVIIGITRKRKQKHPVNPGRQLQICARAIRSSIIYTSPRFR
jgi:hypothetical protein